MKRLFHFSSTLFLSLFITVAAHAQMNYTCPNPTSSAFVSILGTGETIGLGYNLQNNDDAQTAAIDLEALSAGFRFYLSGNATAYRYMGLSVNGWAWFSATGGWAAHNYSSLSSPAFSTWVNNFTNVRDAASFTYKPVLSCFWDDLTLTSTGNSKVAYKMNGVSPNRILTIEWNKVQRYPDFSGAGAASFQIILRENPLGGTNATLISYNYFNEGSFSSAISASIGILGTCPGDYYSLSNSGAAPVASQTIETTNINAFAANNQLYRFTGAVAASGGNDDICNAIALPYNINSTCNTTVGTTKGGTFQALTGINAASACLTAPSNRDVWYTVAKPAGYTTMQISTDNVIAGGTCSSGGVQYQVYTFTGACGAVTLTEIACSGNGGILNPLNSYASLTGLPNALTNYYIRVSGDADAQLDFQICVKNTSNDDICGATDLGVGLGAGGVASVPGTACSPITSTTLLATPSSLYSAPNGLLNTTAAQKQTITGGVDGYTFATPPYISLKGATSVGATITVPAGAIPVGGQIVSVLSGTGVFPLGTTILALPVPTATTFTTSAAPTVALSGGQTVVMASTSSIYDVWFKFKTAATQTDYVIDTYSGSLTDINMAIYAGTLTCPAASGPLQTNNFFSTYNFDPQIKDKVAGSDSMSRIVSNNLLPNTTYYVRVWRSGNYTRGGTFTICAYERPSCGVKATCTLVSPYTPTTFASNPNGNFNATKCTTPLSLPNDTNGICYLKAPKIPTIGTDFAPLCGDNFKGPSITVTTNAAALAGATVFSIPMAQAANLKVGAYIHTAASFSFSANTRVTAIDVITGAPTNALISIGTALVAGLASAATINVIEDMPPNNLLNVFGYNATAGFATQLPNLINPMFYRVKNDVVGSVNFNFTNILAAYNRGIRAGLFTLDMDGLTAGIQSPSSPNYDCYGGTWTVVPTTSISNSQIGSPFAGLKLYGNTNQAAGNYNTSAATGPTNTDKFTMTYNNLPIGIYYLMVDGVGATNGDRAYFDLSITGTSPTGDGVLPIRLLSFTGKNSGGINTLKWSTATETDNDYFTLERSFNGSYFEPIAQIDGAGNSTSTINYSYVDKKTVVGVTYYRLKQTDFNQKVSYLGIVALYSKTGKAMEYTNLRPNPASQNFYVDLVSYENATLTFEIRDVSGKVVRSHNASVNQGENSIETSLEGLENGLYFVNVRDEKSGDSFTKKVVKQ